MMQATVNKTTPYQLKKQAVFDEVYKCCGVNNKEQISLLSVLQFITKEMDSKFKNSESIINDLKKNLKDRSQDGWIAYIEVCEILGNWMDKVSHSAQVRNPESSEFSLEKRSRLRSVSPYRNISVNGMGRNLTVPTSFNKCPSCNKDENCCEWRNNETNREERIMRSFEQKVTELQNLLRESEDSNSVIQLENESLRKENVALQNKEKRWIVKEEEIAEREHKLTTINTLLKEQNAETEKEIQNLKQQLTQIRNENHKLVSENRITEEKLADRERIDKLLNDSRIHQTQLQIELQSKDAIIAEMEAKLEQLGHYNEVLEQQISEMNQNKSQTSSVDRIFEQSISEEMVIADMAESSLRSSDGLSVDLLTGNSLKAELESCGQWPSFSENAAVQATPNVCTVYTQTDELLSSQYHELLCPSSKDEVNNVDCQLECAYENPKLVLKEKCANNSVATQTKLCEDTLKSFMNSSSQTDLFGVDNTNLDQGLEHETSLHTSQIQRNILNELKGCDNVVKSVTDTSSQTNVQQLVDKFSLPGVPESNSAFYVPFVSRHLQMSRKYKSTYEMEVLIMVNALTQTEPLPEETENEMSHVTTCHNQYFLESSHSAICLNQKMSSSLTSPSISRHHFDNCCNTSVTATKSRCCRETLNMLMLKSKQENHHHFLSKVCQVLFVFMIYYLFQTWQQFNDGLWSNFPPFWSEVQRIFSQKMELRWPNGPPPQ